MGLLVSLGVGRLEIDWGKNEFFRNHSALFLPYDVRDAPYYYADDVVEQNPAFVRGLPSVAVRPGTGKPGGSSGKPKRPSATWRAVSPCCAQRTRSTRTSSPSRETSRCF